MQIIGQLSYIECATCKNYFFIHEIGEDGLNDPICCPYCGTSFAEGIASLPEG